MKISDLTPGQKVKISGVPAEYKGIQKIKVSSIAKVEKRVFEYEGKERKLYSLADGAKTLESENIEIV